MTDATRQAVLNALDAADRALDAAELLLDHQPAPRGALPLKGSRPIRAGSVARAVLMVLGVLAFVAIVITLNVWWVRHTWN